jgi:murein DD-endopeptidase MepM/ murein hydrolase activator NlpD
VPVTQYKKAEKEVADRIGKRFRIVWSSIRAFVKYVLQKGKQRFTVMLIPHSEKKIFNFQISFFTLIFLSSVLLVVLVGFFVLATHFTSVNEKITEVSEELRTNETTLESMKDKISGFRRVSREFKTEMDGILKVIGSQAYLATGTGGPIAGEIFQGADEGEPRIQRELTELENMKTLMENSIEPLAEVNKAVSTFKGLLSDTPTLWPLKGTRGIITTRFGWTTSPPIHVQGYLHTGLDLAWAVGTPIVATANGEVAQVGYSDDLGNYIQLNHKYGFKTKYAHLVSTTVRKGQRVNRGDTIGYMGNTGLSTGPHLHYEVRLGSEYVDPMNFLSIELDINAVRLGGRNGE